MSDDASDDLPNLAAASGLVLVPTPIGNLGDLAPRAAAMLRGADAVLCEDTRVTSRLLAAIGVSASLSPLHEHNEDRRIEGVLAQLRAGRCVALVSDAGMPLLSDPGYRLVRAALAERLPVHGLPGPHAATLALMLSGLPPHPYLFAGFPPPKSGPRRAAFAALRAAERAGLSATLIWHEAPHRLAETLTDLLAMLGDRPAAVARELTKRFEEVRREPLSALVEHYAGHAARGEVTVVVGPPAADAADQAADDAAVDAALAAALGAGQTLKQAVAAVTAASGRPRRDVYARALLLNRTRENAPGERDGTA